MEGMSQETLNKMKEEYEQKKNAPRAGGIYWSPPDGETEIRILPASVPDKFFYKATATHTVNEQQYICPKHTNGAKCPICEVVAKLWKSSNPEDITQARSLKARKKFYTNIIIRTKEGDKGPMIWTFGQKMFDKILGYIFDPDYGDITHLTAGYDWKIIRKQKDGFPNYDDSKPRKNPSKAGSPEQVTEWMAKLHDIEGIVNKDLKSYTDLKNVLMNTDDGNEPMAVAPVTATPKAIPGSEVPADLMAELKSMKGIK